jgi:ABC-2 type transport system permease protein
MSKIIAIAVKDMKLRFSSKIQLLFFLILPVIFTVLLSGMLFGGGSSKILLIVVDEDNTDLSRELVSLLQASPIVAPSLMAREEAQQANNKRDAAATLVIPSGMQTNLQSGQAVTTGFPDKPDSQPPVSVHCLVLSCPIA